MCGRTSLAVDPEALRTRFDVEVPDDIPRRYNIAPGDDLVAIRNDATESVDVLESPAGPMIPTAFRRRSTLAARRLQRSRCFGTRSKSGAV